MSTAGIGLPRRGEYGRPLPSPRLVSMALVGSTWQTSDTEYTYHTDLLTHFGQLLAHDITLATTFHESKTVDGKTTKVRKSTRPFFPSRDSGGIVDGARHQSLLHVVPSYYDDVCETSAGLLYAARVEPRDVLATSMRPQHYSSAGLRPPREVRAVSARRPREHRL